ncbi:MAG: hypothetical protein IKM28_07765 [Lachnospiraceae bacterium]|nr:hypothetical protein [Lachnospiraceae bacterium]
MKARIRDFAYYLFFGLMIFAKGIGLDSGDRLYYLLGAAACLCVAAKLVLTQYNKKQLIWIAFLVLLSLVAYRNSGRMGIILSVMSIIGSKDMERKKLFRLGAVVYGASFAATVTAAGFGLITNPLVVHEKGGMEMIRWGMGYSTGNVFHISYFILTVLLCYIWGKSYGIRRMAGLMAGNLLVFLFSLSYTGVAVTAFYLLLGLYAVKRKRLSGVERLLCQLPLPLCLLFSFGGPLLLEYPLVQKLDGLLQARLTFSAYYLQNQPITLLGTRMKDIPNFWVIMDNGYVYCLMTFGIVVALLLFSGYGLLIGRYSGLTRQWKRKELQEEEGTEQLPELAILFSCCLYGIMEQFITNAFMNLSLLFLGDLLFGSSQKQEEQEADTEREREKKSHLVWCLCSLAGGVLSVVYMFTAQPEKVIPIPVDSLNYVDAVSLQLQIDNPENSKEKLREAMAEYQQLIEESERLGDVLQRTGLEEKLTVGELGAALEYSLPVFVHRDGGYYTFRVRLLKLYEQISSAEYYLLMEGITEIGKAVMESTNLVKGELYEERIGKSFGEDRIEHMSLEKEYEVEKGGMLVRVETIRKGVFYGVVVAVAGTGLFYVGSSLSRLKKKGVSVR